MKYNIHCFLYDITNGHFKSKRLCKHNYHNYMLRSKIEVNKKEDIKDEHEIITKYHRIWTTYYKCYCCGKEVEEIE